MRTSGPFARWFGKRTGPRVVMTLLVRDEADIIRENIEFHLNSGVDFIIAMDNHSVDGTTDILKEFVRTGRLQYVYEELDELLQDTWVTQLAQRAHLEHHADWIINGDADEFFIPQGGNLKGALAKVPPAIGAVSIKRNDMVPIRRPMRSSPALEMIYRKRTSLEWVQGHPIIDKVIHRGFPDVKVGRGSHVVESRSLSHTAPCTDILTFHFPIRSRAQFAQKVRNTGLALAKTRFPIARYNYWYSALLDGKLDQVYSEYELSPHQLSEKLLSGEIIEDHRLADLLNAMSGLPPAQHLEAWTLAPLGRDFRSGRIAPRA